MKRLIAAALIAAALVVPPAASALADGNPSGTGQPNQSCQNQPSSPGNASSAPGSAFNENGGTAGSVYAGSPGTPSAANGNGNAVSQYDVACYQVSQP